MARILVPIFVLLFGFAAALPSIADAQELKSVTVTGIKTPKLFIFESAEASKPEAVDKNGALQKITGARCCTDRMMVEISSDDPEYRGYVLKQHLTLDGPSKKLTAGCNQQVAATQVGSTRGLGEDCKQ